MSKQYRTLSANPTLQTRITVTHAASLQNQLSDEIEERLSYPIKL